MRHIYANHAHIFPEFVRKDGTIAVLRQVMQENSIEKCICFAPFYEYFSDAFSPNDWLAEQLASDNSLFGFGVINFHGSDIADQVQHIADLGFKGIKLHPAFQKVKIDGPECCQVYDKAQELNLFISFHTGIHWHRISDYNMLLYDEVAYRYPKLRFSMEHMGGYCFFSEALAVMLNNQRSKYAPRVFAGITSVFDREMNKPWFLSDQQIKDLLWQMGEDSSIFGLDFPFNSSAKIHDAIEHIINMDIPESAKNAILGGNLERILKLDD